MKPAKKFTLKVIKNNCEVHVLEVIACSVSITVEIQNNRKLFSVETDKGGNYKIVDLVFAENVEIIKEEIISNIDMRSERSKDFVNVDKWPLNYFIDDLIGESPILPESRQPHEQEKENSTK